MSAVSGNNTDTVLMVRAVPNASRNEVAEVGHDFIRVRLQAPPVEGKANKALVEFLSETLAVRSRQISIAAGQHARLKRVAIAGMAPAEVLRRISGAG
jgi:uncharacterized protein (TIGR00251 family)